MTRNMHSSQDQSSHCYYILPLGGGRELEILRGNQENEHMIKVFITKFLGIFLRLQI